MANHAAVIPVPIQAIKPANRVSSIDLLRGLVMIIMALDHIRDYFHVATTYYDPTDLAKTTPELFFTRFITHFCAPTFMLLSGTSAWLVGKRKGRKALSRFLLTRGIWLVVLEITVVNFGWYFTLPSIDFAVISALGFSMILLSALIYLPLPAIAGFGIILVFGHNLLDNIRVPGQGIDAIAWSFLHQPIFLTDPIHLNIIYPIIPWVGVMALGYCLGKIYDSSVEPARRKKILTWMGSIAIILFVIIRFINIYGDPVPWEPQSNRVFTFLSFLNVFKYPPSLLYLLVTLGPALLFLAFFENSRNGLAEKIKVIGRVPMFYYLVHIYLLHLLAMFATLFCPHDMEDMIMKDWIVFAPQLKGHGFSLAVTYGIWLGMVILLYFMCRWYDNYKRTHKYWWLSYL